MSLLVIRQPLRDIVTSEWHASQNHVMPLVSNMSVVHSYWLIEKSDYYK